MLKKSVKDDLWIGVLFKFNDDTHSLTAGFIADFRNSFKSFIFYKVRHLFDKSGLVYLIRYFSNHYLLLATGCFLYLGYSPYDNLSLTCPVGFSGIVFSHDDSTCRKIRPLYYLAKVIDCAFRLIDDFNRRINGLTQIMRRD